MKKIFLSLIAAAAIAPAFAAETRYVGGDISLLPEYEAANAQYKTHDGKPIASVLDFFKEEGMNAMRVRLFVNPSLYTGSDRDPNACQTLEYITPLCKRIVDDGYALMLDFHYSDTWADPAKQWTPKEWEGLSDEALYSKINSYTRDVLTSLKAEGIVPAFIQTGNEITYGMLWGPHDAATADLKKCLSNSQKNWPRFKTLLSNAIAACREVCPDAKIILHTERIPSASVTRNFYDQMKDIDYDIIGLSYYPYFHGEMSNLESIIGMLERTFPTKDIMVVETGYPYKWEVPGSNHDLTDKYPYSDAGQAKFTNELVDMLLRHEKVTGLFWWWMEYNAYGTSLSGWYNAPLFDSTTGRATSALKALCRFASDTGGIDGIPVDPADGADTGAQPRWHNLQGIPVENPSAPGIYIRDGKKVVVR